MPLGPIPDVRLHTSAELIYCALEEEFIQTVSEELSGISVHKLKFRSDIQDRSIHHLLGLLTEEVEANGPSGRLYVDSLAHALASRYLLLDYGSCGQSDSRVSGLPSRILKRVREKIEANLDTDLSLESLAQESGYSRAHFLRMFRVATGLTPHQYVLELRLSRAQTCLKQREASIIDVAVACGFASQSHMTSVFRKRLEMTPAEFRRTARTGIACECVA